MEDQSPKPTGTEKFIRIMGMIMSFVYIVLGMGIYSNAIDLTSFLNLDNTTSKILGIGLLVYGGFRLYRSLKAGVRN